MKTSANGINLIKQFEGCRLKAYKPIAAEKYYTIGYGHYGPDVSANMTITQAQADAFLVAHEFIVLVTLVGKHKGELYLALACFGLETEARALCQQSLQVGGCGFEARVAVADGHAVLQQERAFVLHDRSGLGDDVYFCHCCADAHEQTGRQNSNSLFHSSSC